MKHPQERLWKTLKISSREASKFQLMKDILERGFEMKHPQERLWETLKASLREVLKALIKYP